MKLNEEQHAAMVELDIPARMRGAIVRYYERGLPPGHFLTAVISNDLKEAVNRADNEDVALLKNYVLWFYNYAPVGSWGSAENMQTWLESFDTEEEVA